MGLGGVILASVGIIFVVLASNGRWSATWNAALGNNGAAPSPSSGTISYTPPATTTSVPNPAGGDTVTYT